MVLSNFHLYFVDSSVTSGRNQRQYHIYISCILNFHCFTRSFERTTPIWFNKLSNVNGEGAGEFLESRRRIIGLASTDSIVDVISMGDQLHNGTLAEHIAFFKAHISRLSPRLSEIYGVYRLFALEVLFLFTSLVSNANAMHNIYSNFELWIKFPLIN